MKPTPPPGQTVRKRSVARTIGLAAAWLFGVPFTLLLALYVVLLIHPLPLPFIAGQLRNVVVASMPKGSELELGDMALALEGYAWPVIQFSPVVYKDTASGARIGMDALEVGFSPIPALIGQPGATVTVVGPHIQINQDLFGPRLADLEVVPDPNGGPATVRVLEGSTAFPDAGIHSGVIDVKGEQTDATHMRSDNDWLVFNLEAAETGMSSIIEQAEMGRFSRLVIKNATVDMNDALYGFLRTFTDINLDVAPSPNGKAVEGSFSANFGGTVMKGIIERVINDKGEARMKVGLNNFDLSSFVPMINDPDSVVGIVGAAAVSLDIGFDATTHKIHDGDFHVDMTGTDVRMADNYFPIASNIIEVKWTPQTGTFDMDESTLSMGAISAKMKGVFKLGLDDLYGPTVGISMSGSDIKVQSPDLGEVQPFESMSFKGWSAPLYGAVGIDQEQGRWHARRKQGPTGPAAQGPRLRHGDRCRGPGRRRPQGHVAEFPGRRCPQLVHQIGGWRQDRERKHEVRLPGRDPRPQQPHQDPAERRVRGDGRRRRQGEAVRHDGAHRNPGQNAAADA